ncbi:retrovirus-related pol polyprotein from transposon TNT 1-94 [Tanacetum coccineum]
MATTHSSVLYQGKNKWREHYEIELTEGFITNGKRSYKLLAEDAEETEGALQLCPELLESLYRPFSVRRKGKENKADNLATNILLQGIPKTSTHSSTISLTQRHLGQCEEDSGSSEVNKVFRESQLYAEFERFCQIKGETIHFNYLYNSKFVNNMLPEWSRFITEVKLNKVLKESNFDQLYAYLKQHEHQIRSIQHNHPRLTILKSTITVEITVKWTQKHSTDILDLKANQHTCPPENEDHFRGTNARGNVVAGNVGGQNRVGNMNPGQAKPIMCYNCKGIWHIARECPQPKRPRSDYFKDIDLLMNAS